MQTRSHRAWFASLALLLLVMIGCGAARTNATATIPPPTATVVTPAATLSSTATSAASGLVVTVLATDVALKEAPDDRASSVSASFTINGNVINTMVYVSGELPVLETNVIGVNGGTRWTRVHYRDHLGPLPGGVDVDTTGYVRNDLVSAPHAPGAPALPNPSVKP